MNAPTNVIPLDARKPEPAPLPQSVEAEQAVLGAILINNDAVAQVAGILKPEHFAEEIHRRIYDVATGLVQGGKVATPATLLPFLGDHRLGEITTRQYLARLAAEEQILAELILIPSSQDSTEEQKPEEQSLAQDVIDAIHQADSDEDPAQG